jgi:hypothetical protein
MIINDVPVNEIKYVMAVTLCPRKVQKWKK